MEGGVAVEDYPAFSWFIRVEDCVVGNVPCTADRAFEFLFSQFSCVILIDIIFYRYLVSLCLGGIFL